MARIARWNLSDCDYINDDVLDKKTLLIRYGCVSGI